MTNPEENLRKFLQEIAEKENYKLPKIDITPITSEGANFTTVLYTATISEQLKPDLHLFAKVANMTEELRTQLAEVYKIEGLFYGELAPNFERIYNKNNVLIEDRLLMPKYYGHILTHGNETMVLENLQAKGFLNFERQKPIRWEYASTAVTELAKFHAIGVALKADNPMEYEKTIGQLGMSFMNDESNAVHFGKSIEMGCEVVNEEYKSRLQKYCNVEKAGELMIATMLKGSAMLVFGDFRTSNLMHRRRNGKLEVITLDYQTLRPGNPVVDLLYFIFTASDEEFRRYHYQPLLDHYFSRLTHSLKQLNIDVEEVYPRKAFENDVTEFQIFGLLVSLAMVPAMLVEPEDAPEEINGMDSFQVKPNKLAVERINGIVRDFVKWGVI